jgi:Pvc16 N-terminal domain
MSDFTAIAGVTSTLRSLLEQQMPGIAVNELLPPNEVSSTLPLLNLYLYRVEPHPFSANIEWRASSAAQIVAPPFGLTLHYLVVPYGPDQLQIQRLLGEVMRAFSEVPVVRDGDAVLADALVGMTEELRIVPRSLTLSDMLDLWRAFDETAYRLCATYEVSAVLIDRRGTRNVQRVQERLLDVGVLR